MESANTKDNDFTVFDIPGLIEADRSSIQRNKQEIERAFRQCPNSRILLVFAGGVGPQQDIDTYNTLLRELNFRMDSVIFVINKIAKRACQSSEYRSSVIRKLKSRLNLSNEVTYDQFVFVPRFRDDDLDTYDCADHRMAKSAIIMAINGNMTET